MTTHEHLKRWLGRAAMVGVLAGLVQGAVTLSVGTWSNLLCVMRDDYRPRAHGLPNVGGGVHLVVLDEFPDETTERLARFYSNRYRLDVHVGTRRRLPGSAFDLERGQLDAVHAVQVLTDHPPDTFMPGDTLIGLTDHDMYIPGVSWRYAYGYRGPARVAIVSSARMGTILDDDAKAFSRLRKMVTKNVGLLHYGLRPSSHCRSPVFDRIRRPQDLDLMGDDF